MYMHVLKPILTKQYGYNTKNRFKFVSRGFTVVSRGFKGMIYESHSGIGIRMFLKPILTKYYQNYIIKDSKWFQGIFRGLRQFKGVTMQFKW